MFVLPVRQRARARASLNGSAMGPVVIPVAAATIARIAPALVVDVGEKRFAYSGICSRLLEDTYCGGRTICVLVRLYDAPYSSQRHGDAMSKPDVIEADDVQDSKGNASRFNAVK